MADAATLDDAPIPEGRDRWLQKVPVDPVGQVPLFAEAMGRVAEIWTDSFRGLSGTESEFTFKGLQAVKVGDLPRRRDNLPIFAAFRVPAWEAVAGLSIDRLVVTTVVEALFGGGAEDAPADDRPVSPIEIRIVDVLGGQAAAALTQGLKEIRPTKVEFDRTLAKPDTSFLGKPPTPILLATFELRSIGRVVELDLLFQQAAIDAQGAVWGGDAASTRVLDPAGWARQLRSEVSRATLRVEAGIGMRAMTLANVAKLHVGQVLELPPAAGSSVLLRCGEEHLFRCQLGQSAGFYTVKVDEALERQPSRKSR